MSVDRKFYLDLVLLIAVVISLFVSIKSYIVSKNSQKTVEKALEISKEHFLQTNRPYIALRPKKFENGSYYEISQTNEITKSTLRFEMKNLGNIAATDILPPEKLAVRKKMLAEGGTLSYEMPPSMTLGPGESIDIYVKVRMGFKDKKC